MEFHFSVWILQRPFLSSQTSLESLIPLRFRISLIMDYCTYFHNNPTSGLVAAARSRTDGGSLHIRHFYFLKNAKKSRPVFKFPPLVRTFYFHCAVSCYIHVSSYSNVCSTLVPFYTKRWSLILISGTRCRCMSFSFTIVANFRRCVVQVVQSVQRIFHSL